MGLIALNLSFLSTHSSGVSLPFHLWGVEFALLLFKSQLSNTSIFPLCMTFLGYVVHIEVGLIDRPQLPPVLGLQSHSQVGQLGDLEAPFHSVMLE